MSGCVHISPLRKNCNTSTSRVWSRTVCVVAVLALAVCCGAESSPRVVLGAAASRVRRAPVSREEVEQRRPLAELLPAGALGPARLEPVTGAWRAAARAEGEVAEPARWAAQRERAEEAVAHPEAGAARERAGAAQERERMLAAARVTAPAARAELPVRAVRPEAAQE